MSERKYEKLVVWQRGMALTLAIYERTASFPNNEKFGLTSQMRRATVSIPANIAEGSSRSSDRDFGRFIEIAAGSLAELDTLTLISARVGYINTEQLTKLRDEIAELGKMLGGLRLRLARS